MPGKATLMDRLKGHYSSANSRARQRPALCAANFERREEIQPSRWVGR